MSYSYNSGVSKPSWEGNALLAKLRANDQGTTTTTTAREIDDWLISYIQKELGDMFDSNSSLKTLVGVVLLLVWMLLSALLLFRVAGKFASTNNTMNAILSNKITIMLRKIPLSIHFILLLLLGSGLSLLSDKLANFSVGFLGAIMIYYSFVKLKSCKQWFLLIAGIILVIYSLLKGNLLGSVLTVNSAMIINMVAFSSIVSLILILVNHFVYRPKCNLGAEGDLKDLFEN